MLGYTESDLNKMINAVHDAKLFYLRTPSDLMDKTEQSKSVKAGAKNPSGKKQKPKS